jgi:RNA polymerase sigma-70 factor (ECF subfamily)
MPGAADQDFAAFYASAFSRLVGQVFLVTGDLRDAEDLVQEAMARASARWGRLRTYDVPEAWVRRVAMNLAADLRRRSRRRLAAMTRLAAMPATEVVELPTEDLRIVAALGTLPLSQRQVLVLHHLADLPLAEVATTLRVPVGTVKSRLKRARRALAALLSAEEVKGASQDARHG